jgi:MoaA/NifB/PqqE/SkfB family radical SAM enzyme
MPTRYFLPQDCANGIQHFLRCRLRRMRPVPGFPVNIQIQTQTGCNASCRFCPNQSVSGKVSSGRMDEDLFFRLIDEAVKHPVKRISPYLMNEPLADPRLPDLIRYIADRKQPMTRIKINTNASLLDESMAERLIESGLDRLHVSFHGIRKETYESSMGNLSFEKTLANVNRFIELKRQRKAAKPKLKITMVHTKAIDDELDEIRRYWNSRGITVNIHAFENRSHGAVEDRGLNALPMRSLSDCDRLMQQAYILWNGDCVLCCVDWERTTVLGNVAAEGLQSVWQDENYLQFRRNYLAGNVKGTLCAGCKVQDEVDFSYRPGVRGAFAQKLLKRCLADP